MGEIFFRLKPHLSSIPPHQLIKQIIEFEPSIFARHIFPKREQTMIDTKYWHHNIRYINDKGYYGHNFSIIKPKGTIRVIIYGGSAVFDPENHWQESWPFQVQKLLHKAELTNVEVIHAGISGHASFDSFGRFFAEGHLFHPDYVILYNAWNDIKNFHMEESLLRTLRPYYDKNNVLSHYRNPLDQFLGHMSHLYVFFRQEYYYLKLRVGPEGAAPRPKTTYTIQQSALDQYRLNIEMFVDLAKNIKATPILMTQARFITNDNKNNPKILYAYRYIPHDFIVTSFEKTDEIVSNVANRKDVHLIDASTVLTGKSNYFRDHIHLSRLGSAELSKIVAQSLATLIKKRGDQ